MMKPFLSVLLLLAVTVSETDGLSMTEGMSTNSGPAAASIESKYGEERVDFGTFIDEEARLADSTFPISPSDLKEKLKAFFRADLGIKDPSMLDESFEFCAPFVGPLKKQAYVDAVAGFDIKVAFPDSDARLYNIHVDPFLPNRVWYMTRVTATHTGPLLGKEPTGKSLELPPQANSVTFNEEGLVTELTLGYVTDRRLGNTGGLGGLFGLLWAVGQPLPIPECHPYKPSLRFRMLNYVGALLSRFQKKKDETTATIEEEKSAVEAKDEKKDL